MTKLEIRLKELGFKKTGKDTENRIIFRKEYIPNVFQQITTDENIEMVFYGSAGYDKFNYETDKASTDALYDVLGIINTHLIEFDTSHYSKVIKRELKELGYIGKGRNYRLFRDTPKEQSCFVKKYDNIYAIIYTVLFSWKLVDYKLKFECDESLIDEETKQKILSELKQDFDYINSKVEEFKNNPY